jgi:hypothetical protein
MPVDEDIGGPEMEMECGVTVEPVMARRHRRDCLVCDPVVLPRGTVRRYAATFAGAAAGPVTAAMRDLLMFERGGLIDAADGKVGPTARVLR